MEDNTATCREGIIDKHVMLDGSVLAMSVWRSALCVWVAGACGPAQPPAPPHASASQQGVG
jgi:hypothetical protein